MTKLNKRVFEGHIINIEDNAIDIEMKKVGGNDTLYELTVSWNQIKQAHKSRLKLGRRVKITDLDGKLSIFVYPSKKFTKKELQEANEHAKKLMEGLQWLERKIPPAI